MQPEAILESLEQILADHSIKIRYEKGQFAGGLYRYLSKREIIVNKALSTEQRIEVLILEIRENIDLDKVYLIPALREVIENGSSLGK
jgi:hypothetical protein